jgi:hypothetical protein
VDVDYDALEGVLQLSRSDLLLLITIAPHELVLLTAAREADWKDRQSITAGSMLGTACHWCQGEEADTVQLLVGPDDETWELALTLPGADIERMVAAAKA